MADGYDLNLLPNPPLQRDASLASRLRAPELPRWVPKTMMRIAVTFLFWVLMPLWAVWRGGYRTNAC